MATIYNKAGADAAISAAIAALGLGTASQHAHTDYATAAQGALADTAVQPEDLGTAAAADAGDFATVAQGAKADASDVDQITLTGDLVLTLPVGRPAGQVYRCAITQDGVGGHTVTYGGSPVTVDLTAGASTLVDLHPAGGGHVAAYPPKVALGTAAALDVGHSGGTVLPGDAVLGSAPVRVVAADISTATTATFIATIDGIAYGAAFNGSLWRSTDDLQTWVQCTGWTGGAFPVDVRPVADGEVVLLATTGAYRSTGWADSPITATWTLVATPTPSVNGQPPATFIPSVFDTFGQYVLIGEYVVPRDSATALRLSTDSGVTFSAVFDLNSYYPANVAGVHYHGCAIDGFKQGAPRLWFCHGDDVRGVFYSDDLGATWTALTSSADVDLAAKNMMSMTATRYGLVMNTDSYPDGVFRVVRTETPADMRPEMIGRIPWESAGQSLLGFGQKSVLDPATGLVWQTFKTKKPAAGTVDVPGFVLLTDGVSAIVGWQTPHLSTSAVDEVRMGGVGVAASGRVLVTYFYGGTRYQAVLTPGGRGGMSRFDTDKGNALSGKALTRTSIGIGVNTIAPGSTVIIGSSAVAQAGTAYNEVVIGERATAGDNSLAIGTGAVGSTLSTIVGIGAVQNASTSEGTAVGRLAKVATAAVAVGYNADGSGANGVALGKTAKATGTSSIAVGLNATASGTESRAVGVGASATTTGAMAIGSTSSATAVHGQAIGSLAAVSAAYGIAVGHSANVAHSESVALGHTTASSAANQVALGARHMELTEVSAPGAAPADKARLFVRDNGAGKTQLCVIFATGAVQVIATEP